MKKKDILTSTEYLAWLHVECSPDDPYYDEWKISRQKRLKMEADIVSVIQPVQTALKQSDEMANSLLGLAKKGTVEDFFNLPPMPAIVALSLIAKTNEEIAKRARQMLSERQSAIAKKPRPGGRNSARDEMKLYWDEWQKNPGLYKDKSSFIRAMTRKIKSDFSQGAAYKWLDIWELEKIHPNRLS